MVVMFRLALTLLPVAACLASAAPALAITGPAEHAFPDTQSGRPTEVTLTFVTGRGSSDAGEPVSGVALGGRDAAAFSVSDDRCSGRSITSACVVTVRFAPGRAGPAEAALTVAGADGPATTVLRARGWVKGTLLRATPDAASFDVVAPGSTSDEQRIEVTNAGDRTATITSVARAGPARREYMVREDRCEQARLDAGDTCVVFVVAAPETAGGTGQARLVTRTDTGAEATVTLGAIVVQDAVPEGPSAQLGASGISDRPTPSCTAVGIRRARASGGRVRVQVRANCARKIRIVVRGPGGGASGTFTVTRRGQPTFRLRKRLRRGRYQVAVLTRLSGRWFAVTTAIRVR